MQDKDLIAIPGVPDIVGLGFLMMANKTFGGDDYRACEKLCPLYR